VTTEDLTDQVWTALTSDGASVPARPVPVAVTGPTGNLPSPFAVEDCAVASVSAALLAAAAVAAQRGSSVSPVTLDRRHVADAVRSERFFRQGGEPSGMSFASLSRFWEAADGWVRTHANYPWHRRALVDALGTSADPDAVARAVAQLPASEVEDRVYAAGGIATAVRTLAAWQSHPQGRAVATESLIGHTMVAGAPARRRPPSALPLSGVRVLDFTRVIAGPVCTRFLAALGAHVLRLDSPRLPDMAVGAAGDTLLGKRSASLDLGSADSDVILHDLLDEADVVVCGYRPGALDRFGLGQEALTERHGGIVAVYLDAWGHSGPWAGRRGFDSVVQGPTGIAMGQSVTGGEPGALPCQFLDHGTGYLAAAAVIDGLWRQGTQGGTHVRRLSLARTAQWLTSQGTDPKGRRDLSDPAGQDAPPWLVSIEGPGGPVTAVAPPGILGDHALQWPSPVTGYTADPPRWETA
jgi:crotonobetainyl-CoA:carnitine CoA-transferase CaiB-like acyl-CoA transferase